MSDLVSQQGILDFYGISFYDLSVPTLKRQRNPSHIPQAIALFLVPLGHSHFAHTRLSFSRFSLRSGVCRQRMYRSLHALPRTLPLLSSLLIYSLSLSLFRLCGFECVA